MLWTDITVVGKGHRESRQEDAMMTCRPIHHLIHNSMKGNFVGLSPQSPLGIVSVGLKIEIV